MRNALALGAAAASLSGLVLAAPASAACAVDDPTCADTTVTVVVPTGTLSIVTTPVATNGSLTGVADPTAGTLLGTADVVATLVTDTRPTSSGWSVTGTMTALTPAVVGTTAAGSGSIGLSRIKLAVPAAPVFTGVAGESTSAPRPASPTAVDSTGTLSLLTATATGVNTAAFSPQLTVDLNGVAAGGYTGTLTQSVA